MSTLRIHEINIFEDNCRTHVAHKAGNSWYSKSVISTETLINSKELKKYSLPMDPSLEYYVDTENNYLKSNSIELKELIKPISEAANFKNYMFVPETKFSRDWFSRKFPLAKKVIKPQKADIILYDQNSISKYLDFKRDDHKSYKDCPSVYNMYYLNHHCVINKENNKNTLNIYYNRYYEINNNNYLTVYTIKILDIDNYKNKLVNINDFTNHFDGKSADLIMSYDDALELFRQCNSDSKTISRLSIDTVCGYPEKYLLTKFIIMYAAYQKHGMLKTAKNEIYYNKFYDHLDKSRGRHIVSLGSHLHHMNGIYKSFFNKVPNCESEIFLKLINSKEFREHIIESDGPIKINFEIVENNNGNDESDNIYQND